MTTDISKIRVSLNNCEEVTLPYKFTRNCWIKYITIKGEDEAFYEGGRYTGMGDHKIFLINKGKRLCAPTCVRSDDGGILYKSRFFIDSNKTSECDECDEVAGKTIKELKKVVSAQQRVIHQASHQLKILEDKSHEIQIENYDLHGELKEKDELIKVLISNEKKYKLILSQYR
jgi:hypothetical protein